VAAGEGGGSAADDLCGRWEGVRRSGRRTKQRRRPKEERRRSELTGRRSGRGGRPASEVLGRHGSVVTYADGMRVAAAGEKAAVLTAVRRRGGRWFGDPTGGDGGFGQRRRARKGAVGTGASLWHVAARGSVAQARRPGAARGTPGGDGALMSGPGAEREADSYVPHDS
jgi:hypothetical protein